MGCFVAFVTLLGKQVLRGHLRWCCQSNANWSPASNFVSVTQAARRSRHPARKTENQKEDNETTALAARTFGCLTENKMSQASGGSDRHRSQIIWRRTIIHLPPLIFVSLTHTIRMDLPYMLQLYLLYNTRNRSRSFRGSSRRTPPSLWGLSMFGWHYSRIPLMRYFAASSI